MRNLTDTFKNPLMSAEGPLILQEIPDKTKEPVSEPAQKFYNALKKIEHYVRNIYIRLKN